MLSNEGLQQIFDAVCHHPSLRLPLLGRRIAPFKLGCEHLLRRHAGLMKGHAPVGPDGVFAQLRASTAGAVEHDKNLAPLGRDLHTEAWTASVPVDYVCCRG